MTRYWKFTAIYVLAGIVVWLAFLRYGPAAVRPFDAAAWAEARRYERFAMSDDLFERMVHQRWTREEVAQVWGDTGSPRIGSRHALSAGYYIRIVYDQDDRVAAATRHVD